MATEEKKPSGPDLSAGIPAADLAEESHAGWSQRR